MTKRAFRESGRLAFLWLAFCWLMFLPVVFLLRRLARRFAFNVRMKRRRFIDACSSAHFIDAFHRRISSTHFIDAFHQVSVTAHMPRTTYSGSKLAVRALQASRSQKYKEPAASPCCGLFKRSLRVTNTETQNQTATALNASSVSHSGSTRSCSLRLSPSPPRSTTMKSLTSPSAISGWCHTPFA